MTSTPQSRGASLSVRARTPSIHIGALARIIAKAIPTDANHAGKQAQPLLELRGRKLKIGMGGVMRRLIAMEEFHKLGKDLGFLCDVDVPRIGTTAKVGARLFRGSDRDASRAIDELQEAVAKLYEALAPAEELHGLLTSDTDDYLKQAGRGLQLPKLKEDATVVPVEFSSPDSARSDEGKEIARIFTAIETVEAGDWLEKLISGVRKKLQQDGVPEVEERIRTLEEKRNDPASDVRRLLDWLDEEALARVRLQVTFCIMDVIAEQSTSELLKRYVANVREAFEKIATGEEDAIVLDASREYGDRNRAVFTEHLQRAMSYQVLPVWPQWAMQIFEVRNESDAGFATRREVSYRFRINGTNPETGKSAFESRLDRLEERLLPATKTELVSRGIADLALLHLAIPSTQSEEQDVRSRAVALADSLERAPQETLRALFKGLRERSGVMDQIASDLITTVRAKGKKIIHAVSRSVRKYYITVQRGIVDWNALVSLASTRTDVFVKRGGGPDDKIAWFGHLVVGEDPAAVSGLASYAVETSLSQRSVNAAGAPKSYKIRRAKNTRTLAVRIVPIEFNAEWRVIEAAVALFDPAFGVELEYDPRVLTMTRNRAAIDKDKAPLDQMRSAACCAFTLVSYVCLYELLRRLKAVEGGLDVVHIMRVQSKGRDAEDEDGEQAVYAISHALERALGRDVHCKMQGYNLGETRNTDYRMRGAMTALQGGLPIRIEGDASGVLEKVALLSYVTRPCDTHPDYAGSDGFLFMTRSYKAHLDNGALTLATDGMQSRYVPTREALREPQVILEEITRLHHEGFKHILLLSHHYGNRHIGRAAERHAPHATLEFLHQIARRFSGVYVYPLRRDVLPATRLRRRMESESAFEVASFRAHEELSELRTKHLLRSLMPVYTFATLYVVDADGQPQSGFCTYFLDEVHDASTEWFQVIRNHMVGLGDAKPIHDDLIAVLRALHYLESEKIATRQQRLPVLDPFDWATPATSASAGELTVMRRRGKGTVQLSFPAILAYASRVLHKEAT